MASATVITRSISALAISLLRRAKNCCSLWALLHLKGWISSSGISTLFPDISWHIRQVGKEIRCTAELHVTPRQCQLFVLLLFSCAELNPGPTGMSKRNGVEPFSMVTLSTDGGSTPHPLITLAQLVTKPSPEIWINWSPFLLCHLYVSSSRLREGVFDILVYLSTLPHQLLTGLVAILP